MYSALCCEEIKPSFVQFLEEEEVISDNEVEQLKADATKDLEAPKCYVPIWVAVESPSDKIQRAKEELAASVITEDLVEVSNDTSGKDTDSNGKEAVTSGLSPTTKTPKPQRERKKSKSKSGGEEKSADEGEKIEKAAGLAAPKTPPKDDSAEDSKSPKKSAGEEEPNTVQN